jgi:TDG/mug DNA glycosylase family protein
MQTPQRQEVRKNLLPDILVPGLKVIFVGAAPSFKAAQTGHYYAGSRNRFWQLLHQSGFTPRQLEPEEDATLPQFGIGLTGLMRYAISTDNSRLPPPTDADRRELFGKLIHLAPRFICYNGRDVYRMCHGADAPKWGLLPMILGVSRQFVVYSSSGRADGWGAERLYLYRELRRLLDEEGNY